MLMIALLKSTRWLFAFLPLLAVAQTQKFASQFPLDSAQVPAAVKMLVDGKPWLGTERGPVEGLMFFAQEKSGAVWLGGDQGAARFDRKADHRWDPGNTSTAAAGCRTIPSRTSSSRRQVRRAKSGCEQRPASRSSSGVR